MTPTVIILLRNRLAAQGLSHWLGERYGAQALTPGSVAELEATPAADAQLFVTDPTTFVARLRYFLPRQARTIVLTHGTVDASDGPALVDASDTPRLTALLDQRLQPAPSVAGTAPKLLSWREIEVLRLVTQGRLNKEIASELGISINTVLTHRKNITSKLGIKSISGLTFYALMNGLTKP